MKTLTKSRKHNTFTSQSIVGVVTLVISSILSLSVYAQKVAPNVNFAGGYTFAANGVFIDMSFGEFAITTISNTDQIITQGFLQPVSIEQPCAVPTLVYYPNPVVQYITIEALDCDIDLAYIEVFDLLGTVVLTATPTDNAIDLSPIGVGIFIIRAYNAAMESFGSIKIVKISA